MLKRPDTLSTRCFILIVFNLLLFPSTRTYISGKEAAWTADIGNIGAIDWSKAVVDYIRECVVTWHTKKNNPGVLSISGCALFFIIYYLDNLLSLNMVAATHTPRITFYTTEQILAILNEDRLKNKSDSESYGCLPLRSQEATCYLDVNSSMTSARHAPPIVHFGYSFSMLEQLRDCVEQLPQPKQLAASAAFQRCDDSLAKLHADICHVLDNTAQELRHIMLAPSTSSSPPLVRRNLEPMCRAAAHLDNHVAHAVMNHNETSEHVEEDPVDRSSTQLVQGGLSSSMYKTQQELLLDGTNIKLSGNDKHQHQPAVQLEQNKANCDSDSYTHDSAHFIEDPYLDDLRHGCEEAADIIARSSGSKKDGPLNMVQIHDKLECHADSPLILSNNPTETGPNVDQNQVEDVNTQDSLGTFCQPTQEWEVSQQLRDTHNQPHISLEVAVGEPTHDDDVGIRSVNQAMELLDPEVATEPAVTTKEILSMSDASTIQPTLRRTTRISRPVTLKTAVSTTTVSARTAENMGKRKAMYADPSNPTKPQLLGMISIVACSVLYKRLRKRPLKIISPFKLYPAESTISLVHAKQIRDSIRKDTTLAGESFIAYSPNKLYLSGMFLKKSFEDGASTRDGLLEYYIDLLRHDEIKLRPKSAGYRMFLRWSLSFHLNIEARCRKIFYDRNFAETLCDTDPQDVHMISWIFHHGNHFSVYCVNRVHKRIDVTDHTTV